MLPADMYKRNGGSVTTDDSVVKVTDITWVADNDDNEDITKNNVDNTNKTSKAVTIDDIECLSSGILAIQTALSHVYQKNKKWMKYTFLSILAIAYFIYFGYAMYYEFGSEESVRLLWITCLGVFMFLALKFHMWSKFIHVCKPCNSKISTKCWLAISWIFGLLILAAFLTFVIVDAVVLTKKTYNLVSLAGLFVYILIVFFTSTNPSRVTWRTLLWGVNIQSIFALLVLRWNVGFAVIQWLSDRLVTFIGYAKAGSEFVFGKSYMMHPVAFQGMPVLIFISSVTAILYHLGAMQRVIMMIGWVFQKLMGTTAAESMAAAANIFLGNNEAPLLVLPMVKHMTKSELHCLMVGGFATIAGAALSLFIIFGANPHYLVTASFMSAPAALCLAKLSYPETEESKTTVDDVIELQTSPYKNIIEAGASGAMNSIKIIAYLIVNIIAVLSILAFLDACVTWLGNRVGLYEPPLSLGFICSYLLFPFALSMGVELEYCRKVAELIGIKTVASMFYAYSLLAGYERNTKQFNAHMLMNDTSFTYSKSDIILHGPGNATTVLHNGIMSDRSLAIASFSMCGFGGFGSIGMVLGTIIAIAPNRKLDITQLIIRAALVGNAASFMTACFAGLLFNGSI